MISLITRAEVLQRAGRRCEECGEREDLSVHHILGQAVGGSDDMDNLRVLCRPCHTEADRSNGVERGRPEGRVYPHKRTFGFQDADIADIEWLAERWRCRLAEAVRRAVRDAAERGRGA